MINLEKIDYVINTTGAGYELVREALLNSDGDVDRAIGYIEAKKFKVSQNKKDERIEAEAEVIEENGYRYYKRTQLFALELILTMRKLDIPLAEIKTYLSNKSYTNYRNIMSDREIFLEKLLKKIIKTKNELHHSLLILNQLENIKFNDVLTVRTDNEFLYLSKPVSPKMNFKDRTKISASLFINLAEHIPLNNHTFGYVVDKNSLLDQKKPRHIKYYFCPVFTKTDYPKCSIKSKGTYLTLYY